LSTHCFQWKPEGPVSEGLLAQTGGNKYGWVNALATESGVKRAVAVKWMGDRVEPDLASLREVARVLGQAVQIVAAMDGDLP
jgi:hypothetical protein